LSRKILEPIFAAFIKVSEKFTTHNDLKTNSINLLSKSSLKKNPLKRFGAIHTLPSVTDTSKHHRRQTKASPLKTLLSGMTGKAALLEEKARLEAFLTAFPGDYCGWSPDGSVIYSAGFCALLGLERIGSIHDIQNSLNVSDAAALEGVFNTLKETGRAFTLTVLTNDGTKALKISGTRGNSLDAKDHFITLWAEDVSESHFAQTAQDTQMSTLSAAHNTLDCVLKVIPWPIWKRDNKGALIWCNARYADFVGQDIEGVIREQKELPLASSKKKSEEGQPISGSELAAKARTENAPQISKAHIVYNGKRLLMRLTEMPHHDAQTGFTGSIGMAEDISELEELESAIKRFQATQEELLEQLRTAIGVFD
jgi:PAS domain-containing protein